MKVLLINSVCGRQSTGRIVSDLKKALIENGHQCRIAYGEKNSIVDPDDYHIGSEMGRYAHVAYARAFDAMGYGSYFATRKLISWIKQYDPDVIHLHNIHGYYLNIKVLFNYLRICGKKIIWTLHDCWAFTGHSAYCDAVNCDRWVNGCFKCPNMHEYPKTYIDRSEENWNRKKWLFCGIPNLTIVTPSNWLAGLVKKSFMAEYPVEVIHNGIDTSQFYPMENDFRGFYGIGDRFIILGVSSVWNSMKGFQDYIKLSEILGDEYKVVLVGVNEKQKKELPDTILAIQSTNSTKELACIYSEADLYVNLSYCENYPTVNLEAQACGLLVLTYDTGGSPENVLPYGEIVERGNVTAAADAIKSIKHSGISKPVVDKKLIDKAASAGKYTKIIGGGYWEYKQNLGVIGNRILLAVASVWDRRKGISDLIKLSEYINGDNTKLIVDGVSEEQKGLFGNEVILYTHTDSTDELRKLYSVADVLINPTYEDNYPTVNIEAQVSGTPVVTYRTGGSPESICSKNVTEKGDLISLLRIANTTQVGDAIMRNDFQREYMVHSYIETVYKV